MGESYAHGYSIFDMFQSGFIKTCHSHKLLGDQRAVSSFVTSNLCTTSTNFDSKHDCQLFPTTTPWWFGRDFLPTNEFFVLVDILGYVRYVHARLPKPSRVYDINSCFFSKPSCRLFFRNSGVAPMP